VKEGQEANAMKVVLLLVLVSLVFAAAAEFFPTCSTGYSVAFYGGLNGKPQYPFSQALQNVVDGDLFGSFFCSHSIIQHLRESVGVRAEINLLNDAAEVQGTVISCYETSITVDGRSPPLC